MGAIRYFVSDVDRALAFYVDTLNLELLDRWGPAFAIVSGGDFELWLSGPGTSAARTMPDGRVPVPGGWNRIVLEVSDIESVASRLREAKVNFRSDVISGPGGTQVLIDDPDGNPIELFQPS